MPKMCFNIIVIETEVSIKYSKMFGKASEKCNALR